MMEEIEQWRQRLLSVKRANTPYGKAPHKWVLLLAVMRRIETGRMAENVVPLDSALEEEFKGIWEETVREKGLQADLAKPFFHLKNDGFWHLVAKLGAEAWLEEQVEAPSLSCLKDHVSHASLDDELFKVLNYTPAYYRLRNELEKWLSGGEASC